MVREPAAVAAVTDWGRHRAAAVAAAAQDSAVVRVVREACGPDPVPG